MDAFVLSVVPLLAGYGLDLLLGDPRWLPHPVVGFGRAISAAERWFNRGGARMTKGLLVTLFLVGGAWALTAGLERLAARGGPAAQLLFVTVGVFFGLANRTLIREGRAVFRALDESLAAGRARLAWIVGRDTQALDAPQVRTAVLETMSENLSDGVIAPLFYYAIGGLPAMMAYKMTNTLDSMIGHRDARYERFGKAAARLDDAANFIPARLTAGLLALTAGSRRALRFIVRYGRAHASPNAGYPEAALAGILDVRFGGPHRYDGEQVDKPWIGTNPRPVGPHEIERVARLNHAVCLVGVLLIVFCQWMLFRNAS